MGEVVPLDVTRLGRYQILKHLATGGMAEVLIARCQGPFGADHVVVKRVRRDQAADPQFVKMFIDEATLAAGLDHPNIVKVHEIGQEAGEYFFAMEYVHGEDLRRVLVEVNRRRDKLPIALITGIVAAAASGLDYAHRAVDAYGSPLGIVHRDVSPANILIGYDGRVKVADFGIAKAALRSVETRSGTLKGKVSYMSPEQVTGRPVDRRSDVFALGIVLYEVATARRLFKGENDFLTMSSIVQGSIPLPSLHRPDLPRILEDIIMKALAPAPENRYQSADELRAELEKFTHAIGMRMSHESIADYMRKLFGARAEPWLVPEFEPTQTTTIDFDGSGNGLVQPPEASVQRHLVPMSPGARPEPTSPIMMSRDAVTPLPRREPSSGEDPAAAWTVKPPTGTGSAQPLAWSAQQPPPVRRRSGIVLGMTAVAAIAGVAIMMRGGNGDDVKRDSDAVTMSDTAEPAKAAAAAGPTTDEPPATVAPATVEPATVEPARADPDPAAAAKAEAAAKAQIAEQAALDAKEAKAEAARIAKEAAAAKVEIAAKAALDAKAAKAEAARIAKEAQAARTAETAQAAKLAREEKAARAAETAQAAKLAKAEKARADAEAARLAKAEKAEAARLAKAEKARADAAKAETVATKPKPPTPTTSTKPKTDKPTPETKWDPNSLFPE